jgi:uncharacterized protein
VRFIRSFLPVLAVAVLAAAVHAAQSPLPAKPADYVLDEAGVFSSAQRDGLARTLEQYERETSNQVWVCVMPRVPDDYVVEDFTQRTFDSWRVGQKGRDNGIVLFVFPESRTTRIEVGYGLEGAVPDGLANIIIQDDIVPSFRAGDMAGGIERGVEALMAASKGEYTGTGQTTADEDLSGREATINLIIFIIFVIFVIISIRRSQARGGHVYYPSGRRDVWFPSGGSGLGGGGFGGGFSGGGSIGGGGFSGGGGATGRW